MVDFSKKLRSYEQNGESPEKENIFARKNREMEENKNNTEQAFDDDIFDIKSDDIIDRRSEIKPAVEMDIDFSDEFMKCFNAMNDTNDHIFMTGDAGTGKSTLIKYFCKKTKKKAVVLAPTGVAAVNIGGQTVHSFFKFPPKPLQPNNIPKIFGDFLLLYQKVDTIIIDEISMVRVDLMEAIDMFFRYNLDSDEPFAGKQIIMVGDLNQLPPVIGTSAEREMILDKYDSPFFFDAKVFTKVEFKKFRLTKIYRQTDQEFIGLLNKMKNKTIAEADIDRINTVAFKKVAYDETITLCSTNAIADQINEMMLSKIPGGDRVLQGVINGYFDPKYSPVDERITVREGCRIMLLNNDGQKRWHNGTIGTLISVHDTHIMIEIDGIEYRLEKIEYESRRYSYNTKSQDVETKSVGTFVQYPIRLAYAITIHKSQGKTFDKINIDFGAATFAHGQAYVAISRCRTLEGITLTRKLRIDDFVYEKRVMEFYKSIENEST